MTIDDFIARLETFPESVSFDKTMQVIHDHYNFTASGFDNGSLHNEAGSNEGSCKIFAFAKHHRLSDAQTLACFGDYYRKDVLQHPENNDHANIRQFMLTGLEGIHFPGNNPLSNKLAI